MTEIAVVVFAGVLSGTAAAIVSDERSPAMSMLVLLLPTMILPCSSY